MSITSIAELIGLLSYLIVTAVFLASPDRSAKAAGWALVFWGVSYLILLFLRSHLPLSDQVFRWSVWALVGVNLLAYLLYKGLVIPRLR